MSDEPQKRDIRPIPIDIPAQPRPPVEDKPAKERSRGEGLDFPSRRDRQSEIIEKNKSGQKPTDNYTSPAKSELATISQALKAQGTELKNSAEMALAGANTGAATCNLYKTKNITNGIA